MKSCFTFKPKYLPGKKVWKGLTTNLRKLQYRLHSALRRPSRHTHHATARSFQPVYVDELIFIGELQVAEGSALISSAGKEEKRKAPAGGADGAGPSVTSASGAVMMWDVDKRAERFIAGFRKEMNLERERSHEEFMDMLARGANV